MYYKKQRNTIYSLAINIQKQSQRKGERWTKAKENLLATLYLFASHFIGFLCIKMTDRANGRGGGLAFILREVSDCEGAK